VKDDCAIGAKVAGIRSMIRREPTDNARQAPGVKGQAQERFIAELRRREGSWTNTYENRKTE